MYAIYPWDVARRGGVRRKNDWANIPAADLDTASFRKDRVHPGAGAVENNANGIRRGKK